MAAIKPRAALALLAELLILHYSRGELAGRWGPTDVMTGGLARREYRRLVDKLKVAVLVHQDPARGNALYLASDRFGPALGRVAHLGRLTL